VPKSSTAMRQRRCPSVRATHTRTVVSNRSLSARLRDLTRTTAVVGTPPYLHSIQICSIDESGFLNTNSVKG